ncbi:MAG: hypothetical protein PHZ25_03250 [Candidatus Pacebacteria bacterium]|nr:hypothetical protein [Candidatus Paceibacterota bacterium]
MIQGNNQQELEKLTMKKRSSSGGVMWRMLIFSFVVFFLMIAIYVGTEFGYKTFLLNQSEAAREEADNLIGGVPKEEQAAVIDFYSRLSNMKGLLDTHIKTSNFLEILEKRTSQNVYFNRVSLSVFEKSVKLNGIAKTFLDLSKQLQSFQETEGISGVMLDSSSLSQGGQVSFVIIFNVSENILLGTK